MPRRNGAARKIAEAGSSLAGGAHTYWKKGRHLVHDVDDRVEDRVREHPLAAICTAVGVGVALGILLTVACPASFPRIKHRS